MTPTVTALIIEAVVKYGPGVAKALVDIWYVAEPTKADWDNLFAKVDKSYADYVRPPNQP